MLVLDDLVQLCLTASLNVAVGCFDGLACQQGSTKHAQVCSSVAPLDAMNQDVVAVPHRVLHSWPDIRPLLRALLAVGCCKGHQLSTRKGHPPGSRDHVESSRPAALSGNLSTVCRIGSPAKKSSPPFLDVQMQVGA